MRNIIIIGGVSCDPTDKEHDLNPYNFINPGVQLAKRLKHSQVLFHSRSYTIRAKKYPPDKEHSWVEKSPAAIKKLPNDHFLKTLKKAAKNVVEIDSAGDLTKAINSGSSVSSVNYFGHSNKSDIFLEYNTDGNGGALITWGVKDAKNVPQINMLNCVFASFGCYQGERNGLCEKLQKEWLVPAFGARGKTNYAPIGQGKKFPSGNYSLFPQPVYVEAKKRIVYGKAVQASIANFYRSR